MALREAGIETRILVMADFLPVGRAALVEHNLTPVIHDLDDVKALNELGKSKPEPIPFHLKIDSGMCRLGTRASAGEIAAALANNPFVRLEGLMTHFASVADFTTEQTDEQTLLFLPVVEGLQALGVRAPLHASLQYRGHCVSQSRNLGKHGPPWTRYLWLCFACQVRSG